MEPNSRDLGLFQDTVLPNGEYNWQRVVVEEKWRSEVKWDQRLDFGDHDERSGKGQRMVESPGDGSGQVARALNGRRDLWTPPPGRESKLAVVKSGLSYDIRAYKGEQKPSRLYDEDDEELRYKIPPEDVSCEKDKDLEEERQKVIRSQVVRKSTTVGERWSSLEQLGASPGTKNSAEAGRSYSNGFALCFDSPSPGRRRTLVDPQNVDTEQINFAAARQQFLELEKTNPRQLLLGNQTPALSSQGPQGLRSVYRRDECQGPITQRETSLANPHNQGRLGGSQERTDLVWPTQGPTTSHGQATPRPDTAGGNLASSFGKQPQHGRVSRRHSGDPLDLVTGGPDPAEDYETPIEREIRLSREREEDHWRERGITRVNPREELVEIPSSSFLLAAVSSSPASSRKGKEKPLFTFYIQREVEQETKREEALQKEGRVPGTYDKGTHQELAERRKVYEQEVETPPPSQGRGKRLGQELLDGEDPPAGRDFAPWSHHRGGGTENQNGRQSPESCSPSSAPEAGQAQLRKERPLFNRRSAMAHQQMAPPGRGLPGRPGSENPTEELAMVRKEHFAVPVQKLKFSFSGDPEPPKARRKERQPMPGSAREELYTLKTWRPRTSALIDQEIQEALEREMELQEQRRKARLSPEVVPDSRFSSQSSAASGVAGSYSMSISPVFSPTSPPLGRAFSGRVSDKLDLKAGHSPSMRRREDGKYAGIELEDEIDTEVVRSTKAICCRGVLAQMWESGQIHKRENDDSEADHGQD
nr:mitotic interactor and substrate of PLK1 isoform X1 [Pogona vitticeps]XP_020636733.1 mitotic interactor and substrate of PLK1 isoform X1 [Pogona vitticeps]XP_020636734.1 mitotic interactor and substrate of PLK1 isoform X1 [Pogona vitticeps]